MQSSSRQNACRVRIDEAVTHVRKAAVVAVVVVVAAAAAARKYP
jgi:hypothetical protein